MCILCEYKKIHHRTSHVYYVNITYILREYHKVHHRTSHVSHITYEMKKEDKKSMKMIRIKIIRLK